MKIRTWFLGILVIVSIILQISILVYALPKSSNHDLEFEYTYNWDLKDGKGAYYDYKEKFRATGHYVIDYRDEVAHVIGTVKWKWSSSYGGFQEDADSGIEKYEFSYLIKTGQYLDTNDQDYNATGLNIWFYIPNLHTRSTFDILNTSYTRKAETSLWVQGFKPVQGIQLVGEGEFRRENDVYGNFLAKYQSEYYFTKEGFLIGEKYSEYNEGQYQSQWSSFVIDSEVFVTSASYLQRINFGFFLLVYYLPLVMVYILLYPYSNIKNQRPKVKRVGNNEYKIRNDLDQNVRFQFTSHYLPLFNAFLARTYSQGGKVVSISDHDSINGVGLIDPEDKIGTFFGIQMKDLMEYAGVDYAFSESDSSFGLQKIETYDIFRITAPFSQPYAYDAFMVKPLSEVYIPPVSALIANEDYGQIKPSIIKWVEHAMNSEIAYVAVGNRREQWIIDVMTAVEAKKFPPPDVIGEEVIMGVGFATLGNKVGWLYGLYIHPAFRNMGVGKTLALARIAALKELGAESAITEIAEWNGPAKKIYERFNAEKIGKLYLYGKRKPTVRVRRH
jgi:ribosomal protein S18 acetylase RimI-like enzyme